MNQYLQRGYFRNLVLLLLVLSVVTLVYEIAVEKPHFQRISRYISGIRPYVEEERVLTAKTFAGVAQDDPALVNYIRHNLLQPPSQLPYNLANPERQHFSEFDQSSYADSEILHGMRGGFFVEVGAVDGEYLSNSLYFERNLNWTGLLIEAFPQTYHELLQKHRKAYTINTALAMGKVSAEIQFSSTGRKGVLGQISNNTKSTYTSKALPIYSLLLALNVTQIDFFSLDVEGFELKVLQTIPWDKIKIRLLCVEYIHVPEGRAGVIEYMNKQGYATLRDHDYDIWFGWPDLLKGTMKKVS
ncbi:protein Star-like [Procambarus clarkii]|uniref:protein Star-like n=1 Tax=Procambarus clarkii TaxID=6728 RepID=UPI0037437496